MNINKINLKQIKELKIKLMNAIKECSIFSNLSSEEKTLLDEISEYIVVDHVGQYTKRYDILLRYYYIISGIIYQHKYLPITDTTPTYNWNFYDDIPF